MSFQREVLHMSEIHSSMFGDENENEVLSFGETIEALLAVSEGEVRLASVDGQLIASFYGSGSLGYVEIHSTLAMMRQIAQFLNDQQASCDPERVEILKGLACLAGLDSQGNQALMIAAHHLSDNCLEFIPEPSRFKHCGFNYVRKFPIPAQCKNAHTGHSPGMRRR